jgi:hypothetical protein
MAPIDGMVNLATKKVANGLTRKVVWISTSVIVIIAGAIFVISGKYNYVISSCDKVNIIEKSQNEMKVQLTEMSTDIKWLCKQYRENKGK